MMGRGHGPNGARRGAPHTIGAPMISRPLPQAQASSASPSTLDTIFSAVVNKVMGPPKKIIPPVTVSGTINDLYLKKERLAQENSHIKALIAVRLNADPAANMAEEKAELVSNRAKIARITQKLKKLNTQKQTVELQRETNDFMRAMHAGVEELKQEQAAINEDANFDVDEIIDNYDELVKEAVDRSQDVMGAFLESEALDINDANTMTDEGNNVSDSVDAEIDAMRAQAKKSQDQAADAWSLSLKAETPAVPKTPTAQTSAPVHSGTGTIAHPNIASRTAVDPIVARVAPSNGDMDWLMGDS